MKLTDVADIVSPGVSFFSGERPYVATGEMDTVGKYSFNLVKFDNKPSRANQEAKEDDVLFARMVNTIKVCHVTAKEKQMIFSTGFCVLRPNREKLDSRYLYHYLRSSYFQQKKDRLCTGATQKAIINEKLDEIEIPLPGDTTKQRRLATILDKADAVQHKNQESILLSEIFLKSVFFDMFGAPVANPKGWDTEPLTVFCSDIVDCPHSTPDYSSNTTEFPCIRSSDLDEGRLVFESTKYVSQTIYMERIQRLKPSEGDIIFCREGARLGNSAIIPTGITPCLGQRTMLFRIDKRVATPEFLIILLNDPMVKKQFSAKVIGAAAPRINVGELIELRLICPPLKLQEKYADFYKRLDSLRRRQLASKALSDEIRQVLVQQAFLGEL